MNKDPLIFLRHIFDSISAIEDFLKNTDKKEFDSNLMMQDAVVRRLEIIGEATKNLPVGFKQKHKEIPWKDVAGMRDKLTHHYFGINLENVWKVIQEDIPKLKIQIEKILNN